MSTVKTTNIAHPSSGSNNVVLAADGSATIESLNSTTIVGTTVRGGITSGTAQSATGTAVDFTGIPSWVKRITVMFDGVSTNGTSTRLIQLGDSGGVEITGYLSGAWTTAGAGGYLQSTAGYIISIGSTNVAAETLIGSVMLTKLSGNTWVSQGVIYATNYGPPSGNAGSKTLSDTLTQLRITTVNGTDTFDAGTINIMYEG